MEYVTNGGWSVSYLSGDGVDGVRLCVYRYGDVMDPLERPERCPDCDGREFRLDPSLGYMDAMDAARREATLAALAHGHLRPYEPPVETDGGDPMDQALTDAERNPGINEGRPM